MTPQIIAGIVLALVALGVLAAWLDARYDWTWGYIQRHVDRALEADDDREASELPIHDDAVRAIRERGGWVSEGWTP